MYKNRTDFSFGDVAVFDLNDLGQPPKILDATCRPFVYEIDLTHRRLYIANVNCHNSLPHRGLFLDIYDLDTLDYLGDFVPEDHRGGLSNFNTAVQAEVNAITHWTWYMPNEIIIFDRQGQLLQSQDIRTSSSGLVLAPEGDWLYLLQTRGLDVLRVSDLSMQSSLPLMSKPKQVALSPNGEYLYLETGSGTLEIYATAELQSMGFVAIRPFPTAWREKDNDGQYYPIRVYQSAEFAQDQTAFVTLTEPSEIYQTTDGGQSWTLVPLASRFSTSKGSALSISPNFGRDQTLNVDSFRITGGDNISSDWMPRLAFTSDCDGNREIYTRNLWQGERRRHTNNPAVDENPAWSPAWTQLAFQSNRTNNWDIYRVQAIAMCIPFEAECGLQQLTQDAADDMLPAWSPDGRTIAFVSTRDGNPEIYVMDQQGQNQHRLTFDPHGDWRPAWLPDSQRLVFTSDRNGNNDIYLVTVPSFDAFPLEGEPEIIPVITNPADDRDPTVGFDNTLYFLSDRTGEMFVHQFPLDAIADGGVSRMYHVSDDVHAEAHPNAYYDGFGEGAGDLLVSREVDMQTDIYLASPYSVMKLTDMDCFEGQPTGGPVWWQPDPDESWNWITR